MLQPEFWVSCVIVTAILIYALTGGADFGAGMWYLSVRKPQKDAILKSIAPVWEANHVWLIVPVVLLFVAFPKAFAAISTALYIPLFILLLGIVGRGAGFAFLYYGKLSKLSKWFWGTVFCGSSLVVPMAMGVIIGTIFSGNIRVDVETGAILTDFISPWLSAYPLSAGALTFFLFASLGASYMIFETQDIGVHKSFRLRAIFSGLLMGWMTLVNFLFSEGGALGMRLASREQLWAVCYFSVSSFFALGALMSLITKRDRLGRFLLWGQTAAIIIGWAVAQHPHVVVPDLTLTNAAAPAAVLVPLLIAVFTGLAVIIPVFVYFYWVFKGPQLSFRSARDIIRPGN